MALFPPAIVKEDSSKFKIEFEDKAIRSETEGGYVYTRPRHGRDARRKFSTGFTDIDAEQKTELVKFLQLHGTYLIFDYLIPDTGEQVVVRLDAPFSFDYVGVGGNHRYNCHDVTFTEV